TAYMIKVTDPVLNSINELENDRRWFFPAEIRRKLHGLHGNDIGRVGVAIKDQNEVGRSNKRWRRPGFVWLCKVCAFLFRERRKVIK
ncbi:hypothetical protein A2U01_0069945, partial [Trifolium medium]|nr:hypothetical protein [Trifolium medium]